jgi:hypothetical protein
MHILRLYVERELDARGLSANHGRLVAAGGTR